MSIWTLKKYIPSNGRRYETDIAYFESVESSGGIEVIIKPEYWICNFDDKEFNICNRKTNRVAAVFKEDTVFSNEDLDTFIDSFGFKQEKFPAEARNYKVIDIIIDDNFVTFYFGDKDCQDYRGECWFERGKKNPPYERYVKAKWVYHQTGPFPFFKTPFYPYFSQHDFKYGKTALTRCYVANNYKGKNTVFYETWVKNRFYIPLFMDTDGEEIYEIFKQYEPQLCK